MEHQFEIALADKAGAFEHVVETLVKHGLHIRSAAMTYTGGVSKGAKPTGYFTVDSKEQSHWAAAHEALGEHVKELKTTAKQLTIEPKRLVETLRNLPRSGGGAGMCSFFYIDRGDPAPDAKASAAVTFFA